VGAVFQHVAEEVEVELHGRKKNRRTKEA